MTSGSLESRAMELLSGALDQPASDREAWVRDASGEDSALFDRVMALLDADQKHGSVMQTGGAGTESAMPPPPERVGAYKITGLIGQGGMGAVYEGKRVTDNFDHTVAIKIVRPGALSDALTARFERERQILASLNHPNIARLFDGGELDDGAPYIVMEYVDGVPISEWARTQALPLDARLSLFSNLCGAVRHAHQNLIIHRDITPSNVLVTLEGEVKLIDFGIAKPHATDDVGVDPEANSLGGLSFTPGYAAPERSKGAAANTLSDVYSLGKILATLTQNKSNADLSAIISCACASDPDDRYASVDALLEDVQNLRNGQSVEARGGSAFYHFRKFLSRRRYAAAASLIGVSGLVLALGVVSGLYRQAERAEASAQTRFNETRALTQFLINDVSDELVNVPGTLPAQRKIVQTSSEFLDILSEAAKSDKSVRLEYAMGLAQIADVTTQAGGANLGDPETGRKAFEESLEILRELASEPGASNEVKLALADTEYAYGYSIGYHFGELRDGMERVREALAIYDEVLADEPGNAQAAIDRQVAWQTIIYYEPDESIPLGDQLDAVEDEWVRILEEFPDHPRGKPKYTSFLRNSAEVSLNAWDTSPTEIVPVNERVEYEKALARVRRSIEFASEMIEEEPTNTEHIYQLIWSIEIEAWIAVLDVEWRPSFENLIADLSEIGRSTGRRSVAKYIVSDPAFNGRKVQGDELFEKLDYSDLLLERLAPFDGETFTHTEAVYYNLKARAYAAAQLRLDLGQSEQYLNDALAMTNAFLEVDPDFRNAKLERAATLVELVYLHVAQSTLYGEDRVEKSCRHLATAKNVFEDLRASGDELEFYVGYYTWALELSSDLSC